MMGEESDYLSSQCDDGAADDMRELDRRRRDERINFRKAVASEVTRQLKLLKVKASSSNCTKVTKPCAYCGTPFDARVADVNRGWGKFCSKSCAAHYKDKRTGGSNRDHYGY